jgi:hypothetical protein
MHGAKLLDKQQNNHWIVGHHLKGREDNILL